MLDLYDDKMFFLNLNLNSSLVLQFWRLLGSLFHSIGAWNRNDDLATGPGLRRGEERMMFLGFATWARVGLSASPMNWNRS